jgi:hypothetical protein
VYEVTTDEQSYQQIDALPVEALAPFAEARAMLEPSLVCAREGCCGSW